MVGFISIKGGVLMKRYIIRIFFCAEIGCFLWMYFFGPQGIQVFKQLADENAVVEQKIQVLRGDIAQLDRSITACNSDSFYKERIAREQLQMARKGDVIYYFD